MNQKLTLSIDSSAVARGKSFAKQNGRSLSSVIESFLLLLDSETDDVIEQIPISNKLMSLVGIGSGSVSESDFKKHRIDRNDG